MSKNLLRKEKIMRSKLGIIPIKIRAKDSSTINLSQVRINDVIIDGDIKSAINGKLILLDVSLVDGNDNMLSYNGIVKWNQDLVDIFSRYTISILGINNAQSCVSAIEISILPNGSDIRFNCDDLQ